MSQPQTESFVDHVRKRLSQVFTMAPSAHVMCMHRGARFFCTREKGHQGPHAAHTNPDRVIATWPEEPIR